MAARPNHAQTAADTIEPTAFAITYTALYQAKLAEFNRALESAHGRARELGPAAVSAFLLRVDRIAKEFADG
jgi:hypothetical protein